MRRTFFALASGLSALLFCPPVSVSQVPTEQAARAYPKAILSNPFTPTLGDMIALSTSELVTSLRSGAYDPTIAIYDREAKRIAIIVYGSRSTLDGAKKSLDEVRSQMQSRSAMIGSLYHVTLSEADFTYIYYHGQVELVRWEDGKYTIGGE